MAISKESSCEDIINFLKRRNLDDLVDEFEGKLVLYFSYHRMLMVGRDILHVFYLDVYVKKINQLPLGFNTLRLGCYLYMFKDNIQNRTAHQVFEMDRKFLNNARFMASH